MRELPRIARQALRMLLRTPAFAIPAVLSLAIGIAVNTVIFSVFNAALLRPVGAGGDDLVRIGRSERGQDEFRSLSYDAYVYLRQHATSYLQLIGHQVESAVVRWPDETRSVSAELIAGPYFTALGVTPALGHAINAEDAGGFDAEPVIVISDGLWRRRFGANRNVIGSTIIVNDHPFTIAGVAPRGFHGSFPGVAVDVWIPAALVDRARPGTHERSLLLIGRLRSDVTRESAVAELGVLARRLSVQQRDWAERNTLVIADARGVHPAMGRVLRTFLSLLMAVVALVLLIACANVASLLLARATARRGEFAIRLALGASRVQLAAQLLMECLVLAVIAGGVALLLVLLPLRLLSSFSPTVGPAGSGIFFDLGIDRRVMLFTAIATLGTAFVFGLAPAVQATRASVMLALRDPRSLGGRIRSRLRGALVVVQICLSVVLLVAAGLMFRSVQRVSSTHFGFDPDHVIIVSPELPSDYETPGAFLDELLARARTLPGVEHAALADFVPMGDRRGHPIPFVLAGTAAQGTVAVARVSDGYFETVRQPLTRGRSFAPDEGAQRVVVVNEAFARSYWPGSDPIGRRIALGEELTEHEVVGVAADANFASFAGDIAPLVYLPAAGARRLQLHVRTLAGAAETLDAVRRIVHDIDARVPRPDGRTMRDAMAFSLIPARIGRAVFSIAAGIAVLLAASGLYGLVSYMLQLRLREIGIRIALGADRRDIFGVVVGTALRLTIVGVAAGILLAFVATRVLASLLHGVQPTDPVTFVATALLLLGVALTAAYAAGRAGLRLDPAAVLRME